jgi:DNA repair exonuclease SbcCD ATPase subunit
MASPKFNRIHSVDQFPLAKRLHMTLNLVDKKLNTYYMGRDATPEETYTALWQYHQALTHAESQIERLQALLRESRVGGDELEEYLEEFEDLSPVEVIDYRIDEIKQDLFFAMMKNNEKKISGLLNQIDLLEARKEASNA